MPHPKHVVAFLYVWLMVGFSTGTLVLLGPTGWVTGFVRERGWSAGSEDHLMWGVILCFVAGSFLLALLATRFLLQYRARASKTGVLLAVTGVAGVALWGWMDPAVYAGAAGGGVAETVTLESGARFVFGAYPDAERLAELKREGVTGVISLQHPAVVPFEPEGIQKEKVWTEALGITFVHAPMLPWVSANEKALETIREIVDRGEGTWYVHCGLGRDRVNVVRRMIESMEEARLVRSEPPRALGWEDRVAERLGPMERGAPVELAPDVWLVPFPNEHEFFGHMLAGQVAHVVLLLDPADEKEAGWIEEATALFDRYELPYTRKPLDPRHEDAARRIAREVSGLPRPLTVVAPFTEPMGDTRVADAFAEAWEGLASMARAAGR